MNRYCIWVQFDRCRDTQKNERRSSCLNTIFVIWIIIDSIRMYQKKIFPNVKLRRTVHCLCFENAHDSDFSIIGQFTFRFDSNAICIYFYFPINFFAWSSFACRVSYSELYAWVCVCVERGSLQWIFIKIRNW